MRQIQELTVEDEQLSNLVQKLDPGQSLTLVRNGQPVGRITPVSATEDKSEASREAAWQELEALMEKGWDLGIVWNGRDELYDRD